MTLHEVPRLFRTVRHLRPSQILWRLRYGLDRKWRRPRAPRAPDLEPLRSELRSRTESYPEVPLFHRVGPCGREALDALSRGEFTHLDRTRTLGRDEPDWRLGPVSDERLWTITLHYHEWAYALAEVGTTDSERGGEALDLLRHYVGDWIERCDLHVPGARDLAWNSYAIATRIGWWIRTLRLLAKVQAGRWPDFERAVLRSLWRQAAFLHEHLEWDLRANHLLRDVVGLAWAGRFFDGPRARRWLATATRLAGEQLDEQVLADGAHFERSPMYHVHAMEDVLSLALLLRDPPAVARACETWRVMAEYLAWLRYEGDEIPLLNDAAQRAGCSPTRMLELGGRIGEPAAAGAPRSGRHFAESGLAAWRGRRWTLFFDVGPVGPDYQPGHAHADTLGFECAVDGVRLFVDPGTYGYDDDERRRYDRSTDAHNTVCVDGADSSEVWHIFRVGRRARPRDVEVTSDDSGMEVSASHDGYRHLPGRPVHRRTIVIADGGSLRITDSVKGEKDPAERSVSGGFLLEPAWAAERVDDGWVVRRGERVLRVRVEADREVRREIVERPYHPQYGVERLAHRLEWRYEGPLPIQVVVEVLAEGR